MAEVAAAAFMDDPMFVAAIPGRVKRMSSLPLVFSGIARQQGGGGWIDTVERDGDVAGVALWGNGRPEDMGLKEALDPDLLRLLATCGLRSALHLWAQQLEITRMHERVVTGDHRYLVLLAVRPNHQGQGVASQLLSTGLAKCDELGVSAYLETNVESNVALYQRRGFQVVEQADNHGFPTWGMVRPPARD